MAVQPDMVREELARILAYEGITNSAMLSAFLRFIVKETLAGRADRLKAYTIAVEALDRPKDFDPNDNPLVRVQARRLRDVLSRFYADPANVGDIRIELPVGRYVPEFVRTEDLSKPQQSASLTMRNLARRILYGVLGAALLIGLVLGGWKFWTQYTNKAHHDRLAAISADYPSGTGLDSARVLPQIFVTVATRPDAHDWFDADLYLQRVEAFAQKFDDYIVVRPQEDAMRFAPSQPTYQLRFSFDTFGDAMRGVLQITDANDGRLLDVKEIVVTETMTDVYRPGNHSRTPSDLNEIRFVIESYGLIYNDIAKLSSVSGPLACFSKAYAFQANPTQSNHLAARQCLEDTIKQHPQLIQAFALLGAVYLSEYTSKLNPLPGDPLERAEAALSKAIRLLPESPLAYEYMQYLLLLKGEPQSAIAAGKMSIRLNPESMETIGNHGCLLSFMGRFGEAVDLLLRAESRMISTPQWLQFHTFLALNSLGRFKDADIHANHLTGTSVPLFMSAIAISLHRAGNETAAKEVIEAMSAAEPDWLTNPKAILKRHGFADQVAEALTRELVTAGLSVLTGPN